MWCIYDYIYKNYKYIQIFTSLYLFLSLYLTYIIINYYFIFISLKLYSKKFLILICFLIKS